MTRPDSPELLAREDIPNSLVAAIVDLDSLQQLSLPATQQVARYRDTLRQEFVKVMGNRLPLKGTYSACSIQSRNIWQYHHVSRYGTKHAIKAVELPADYYAVLWVNDSDVAVAVPGEENTKIFYANLDDIRLVNEDEIMATRLARAEMALEPAHQLDWLS